jgi:peptide chain release factor 1
MRDIAVDIYKESIVLKKSLEEDLKLALLPKDPNDEANIFLEIRAGTGGDEAALFVADLYKMYVKYAENKSWDIDIVSQSISLKGGFKEIILQLSGNNVYANLKFESGAHRVQRVPETESQGRVHTSACTVAVIKQATAIDSINLKSEDLRIDTYRAYGAGGQHVNKTDSAVRITHIPTNTVVECQDERSQHKNKAKALSLIESKILKAQQDKQKQEEDANRQKLVGTGDRSAKIRTYNYPQSRITDHRINLTLYKIDEFLNGELDLIIQPLKRQSQIEQLQEMGL